MSTDLPSILIYEYPSLAGPPLGIFEPDLDASAAASLREHPVVGILAHTLDDGSLCYIGGVYRYELTLMPGALHVFVPFSDSGIWLQRDEVATQLLRDGAYFRKEHA